MTNQNKSTFGADEIFAELQKYKQVCADYGIVNTDPSALGHLYDLYGSPMSDPVEREVVLRDLIIKAFADGGKTFDQIYPLPYYIVRYVFPYTPDDVLWSFAQFFNHAREVNMPRNTFETSMKEAIADMANKGGEVQGDLSYFAAGVALCINMVRHNTPVATVDLQPWPHSTTEPYWKDGESFRLMLATRVGNSERTAEVRDMYLDADTLRTALSFAVRGLWRMEHIAQPPMNLGPKLLERCYDELGFAKDGVEVATDALRKAEAEGREDDAAALRERLLVAEMKLEAVLDASDELC
jgi:hypothetical protein